LKKSNHSPKKLLPKHSCLSARFIKQNKIKKPKLKLKTSPRLLELADKFHDKYEELRKIEWEKFKVNPDNAITKNEPALLKECESIRIELNKEKFKAATGEDLDSVERKAIGYGDKNSWLTLLRWEIEYLFDEQLIATICKAHEDRTAHDIRFLGEIADIIAHPLKPHGRVDMERYEAVLKEHDGKMSNEKLKNKLAELGIEISDKYLGRIGLKK